MVNICAKLNVYFSSLFIVINSAMANYLLSRLEDCKDLEKVFVLEYLLKHKPKNSNARFNIMNYLDPYITNKSPRVYLATSKLFLKVISEDKEVYKTVIGDFIQRIQPQLRKFLKDPINR